MPKDLFLPRMSGNRVFKPAIRVILAAILSLAALPAAWAAEAATEQTCVVLSIEGKLDVAVKGQGAWKAAVTNQTLKAGDRVRTGNRSRAALRWSDLSVVRVNELTTLEIQPPAKAGNKPELDLKSGAAYFFSREKPSEIQFRTPVASGAIRGTEFNLAVAENGQTELALLDGAVDLANAQGAVTLTSGEQGSVSPGQAPRKTAMLEAANIIQWALYYPAVVDVEELKLGDAEPKELADSLKAYRAGDLLAALAAYPDGRAAVSDAEKVYHAALLLSVGQASAAEREIESVNRSEPAFAVRELIGVVKNQPSHKRSGIFTASEWVAASYSFQAKSDLAGALKAAKAATAQAPNFGFAWVRVAELEFSFGNTADALSALEKGLALSPRNAQGLALKGFLLAAQGHYGPAAGQFDQAIAIDPALGNAWLGRGLLKFRSGHGRAGREDLQVAATLEPNRSMLRSYLAKAFAQTWDDRHAAKELALASKLDPNDPTPWLYSALLAEQQNRPNDAIADLEKSKQLNDNRSVFRSRLLLDQDQAVRGANLAAIYRDAGMADVSVQEAARAVNYDYANFSSHLFLSSSFDALRDPKSINLRYETAWYSELLLANLLAPVGGGNLSQNVSQQEYAQLFEGRHHGIFSATDYSSQGDWRQVASQYGNFDHTAYSFDAFYQSLNGDRVNNDLDQLGLAVRVKQDLTAQDSLFFQLSYYDGTSGDVAQYYNQASASSTVRVREKQLPNLLLGYHREWSPGNHTLFLAGRFDDTLEIADSDFRPLWQRTRLLPPLFEPPPRVDVRNALFRELDYKSKLEAYSSELQQIWQTPRQTLVAGFRLQIGWPDTTATISPTLDPNVPTITTNVSPELSRASLYAYENFKLLENLRLIAGLSYDRLNYPVNVDTAPITAAEDDKDKVSPKVGLLWSPTDRTHLRGSYTRSLGGVFFDNSIRLEPVQVAGFNQAFRSLIPESVAGLVPGTEFETWGVGWDQSFPTRTYLTVQADWLRSDGTRTLGLLTNSDIFVPIADSATSTRQALDFEERSLLISLNQLVGQAWAFGARYKLTEADLETHSLDIAPAVTGAGILNQDVAATLHQVMLFANYNHRCGFFGEFNAVWSQQSNRHYTPDIPGDDFWQLNLYLGYRFKMRHAEARLGLVNLTDQDYQLNPLTLYNELPRQRAVTCSFKFYF